MSIQRESSFTDDKTVMKGGGRDVAVGNPGMMYDTDSPTNLSLSTPKRGSDVHSVTAGSDENFSARTEIMSDDHDILTFRVESDYDTDRVFFVADREMELKSATARAGTAGGSGYGVTINKVGSGTAIGSGTAMTSLIALNGTANTNVEATLSTTRANLKVSSGQAVGIEFAGTKGSAALLTITLVFRRVVEPSRTVE